jgi:hypothetical protein
MIVHVRILHEGRSYIAQCLEYDITGHGDDAGQALENLRHTINGQIAVDTAHGEKPLGKLPSAPFPYWLRIEKANFVGVRIEL